MDSNVNEFKLPNKVYEEVLKEIIKNNLKKSFENYEIIYSAGSSKGDNYLGIIYRIQVIDKDTNEQKLSLIVKLPPENVTRRNEMCANYFFEREADFYDNVYPMYRKFQEEKGIDVEKDGFHHVPFCYKALTEEPNEGLFLEDLNVKGFQMFDRLKEVTKEHVFLVMKALAKMHAIFYAIKDQNPKLVEPYFDFKDGFINMCERENSPFISWIESLKEKTLEVVNKSSNTDMIGKIKKLLEKDFGELLRNCFDRKKTEPYATFCHGDCWNNNVLFEYNEKKIPTDLRLLDFQIVRYASPVCDLMYYIFCCTTKSLRDKHYQEFLDVYYNELSDFMQRLGSDPKKCYSRHIFDEHLKKFGHFGFIMAIVVLPVFTSDANDIPDMDEMAENFKKISESVEIDKDALNFTTEKTYDKYAKRMMDVCDDLFKLGYL